jgi:hypothetical protein
MATTMETRLLTTKEAPGLARRALDPLKAHLDPDRLDDVRLIVSELVSKVVRQSGQPAEMLGVEVTVGTGCVQGRVIDIGPPFMHSVSLPEPKGSSAWALVVVDRVSSRWGIHENRPNSIWFELDL